MSITTDWSLISTDSANEPRILSQYGMGPVFRSDSMWDLICSVFSVNRSILKVANNKGPNELKLHVLFCVSNLAFFFFYVLFWHFK